MEKQSSGIIKIIGLFFINLFWNGISLIIFIASLLQLIHSELSAILIFLMITLFVAVGISELLIPLIFEILTYTGIRKPIDADQASNPNSQEASNWNINVLGRLRSTIQFIRPPAYFPPLSVWIIIIYLVIAGILVTTKQIPLVTQWFSMRA